MEINRKSYPSKSYQNRLEEKSQQVAEPPRSRFT